jgi:cystathionine beta-lyase
MKYNFDEIIERRGMNQVKWDSVREGLLPMWVADMDFRTAPEILKAIRRQTDPGVFGYGYDRDFSRIIRNWFHDEYSLEIDTDWVVLLPAIVPLLSGLSRIREGPVFINTPNYNSLLEAPLKAGKRTILSPLRNINERYDFDFDDMEKRLTPDTRIIYLCNPQNPVGRVYTKEELMKFSAFAEKHGLIVVSDEAHCGIIYDCPHIPFFSSGAYAEANSITIMGPGKTWNLAGLPFGFAVVPGKNLRSELEAVCGVLPHPGLLELEAAKAAYSETKEWRGELLAYLRGNRDYLEKRLNESVPRAKHTHVEGTYLQWIDFRPLGIADPFTWLKEKARVLPSDGKIFGLEGYVRLNFGTQRSRLIEAMDRIEAAFSG